MRTPSTRYRLILYDQKNRNVGLWFSLCGGF